MGDVPPGSPAAPYAVSEADFVAQLDLIAAAGHRFVGLDAVLAAVAGETVPPRALLLTFDDCYAGLWPLAESVLAPRGIPAVAFAVSGALRGHADWDGMGDERLELLDVTGLRAVAGLGVEIGGHSTEHRVLAGLAPAELEAELGGCAAALAASGLPRPRAFAYPHGRHDARVRAAARAAGYQVAFTTAAGSVGPGSDRYALPRLEIRNGDTGSRFRLRLAAAGRLPAPVRRLGAAAVAPPRAAPGYERTYVGTVELDRPLSELPPPQPGGHGYARARLLVRAHRQPVGFVDVELPHGSLTPSALLDVVREQLRAPLQDHLEADGLKLEAVSVDGLPEVAAPACWRAGSAAAPLPPVSVVVCTRDRVESLRRTLGSLLDLDYPAFEVVVVDNAPERPETREVLAELGDARVRHVLEPRPGLSAARNRGLREACHELVAFTDDDVVADPWWLRGLARGFTRAEHVGCVTGMVPPAELETAAQAYFDTKVGWAALTRPRLFDLADCRVDHPLYPFNPGRFGAGANFAVSRWAIETVGCFDEALGAGSPAQGGEDLDFFLRCVLSGLAVAHEPSALVWHVHRREEATLERQLEGYGSGLSAFAFKHLTRPESAWQAWRKLPAGFRRLEQVSRDGDLAHPRRRALRRAEVTGLARGPYRYLAGRARCRRARRTARRMAWN